MSINKIQKYTGHTPLYYASKHNHPECTELLLFYGSPMDQLVNGGNLVDMLISSFREKQQMIWLNKYNDIPKLIRERETYAINDKGLIFI